MTIVTITGYSLSLLWSTEDITIYSTALFSSSLQIVSLFFLWRIIQEINPIHFTPQVKRLLTLVLISFHLKIILQFLSVLPELFEHAILFKANYIIGYIHLFTLGILSPMIFVLFSTNLKIQLDRIGLTLYFLGVIGSELILFGQGLAFSHFNYSIPYFDQFLIGSSACIFIGLLFVYYRSKKREVEN